jgi:hypothetical protein
MRRRDFIVGLGVAGWPLLVRAQQQSKPVIGWLDITPTAPLPVFVEGVRRGLAEIGFSEGRDVAVEYHLADGHPERLSALAADLVRRKPAAILAPQNNSALAAKAVTRDIPIIYSKPGPRLDPTRPKLETADTAKGTLKVLIDSSPTRPPLRARYTLRPIARLREAVPITPTASTCRFSIQLGTKAINPMIFSFALVPWGLPRRPEPRFPQSGKSFTAKLTA